MFGVVFPLAPGLALINNMMEIKVDFIKLSSCRRPALVDRSTLNGWFTCLSVLSVTAIFTNSFMLCIVSHQLGSIIPTDYLPMVQTEFSRSPSPFLPLSLLLPFVDSQDRSHGPLGAFPPRDETSSVSFDRRTPKMGAGEEGTGGRKTSEATRDGEISGIQVCPPATPLPRPDSGPYR
jgi:hypothetical protein